MSLRAIGKFCFLLVIIGFFMPIACQQNGFQLANLFIQMDSAATGFLLYGLFITAIIGLIIGVLLMLKKNVPNIVDWIILLVCICCGLVVYFGALSEMEVGIESGAYFILIGWISILILQIASTVKKS
jgi:hypothetical protein